MTTKTISELEQAARVKPEDLFLLEQDGQAKNMRAEQLAAMMVLPVRDVQANGISVVQGGTANIPAAQNGQYGLIKWFGQNGIGFWAGTQADYDAIAVKENTVFYFIMEDSV